MRLYSMYRSFRSWYASRAHDNSFQLTLTAKWPPLSAHHTRQALELLLARRHTQPVKRRRRVGNEIGWGPIFFYLALVEHQHAVAEISLAIWDYTRRALMHDRRESMGYDNHRCALETFLDRLRDLGVHPIYQHAQYTP